MNKEFLFIQLLKEQVPLFECINSMELSHITESELEFVHWSKNGVELKQYLIGDDLVFESIMLATPSYGFTASFYINSMQLYDNSELYFGPEDLAYKNGFTLVRPGEKKHYTVQFPDRKARLKMVKKGTDKCVLYFLPMRIELPD